VSRLDPLAQRRDETRLGLVPDRLERGFEIGEKRLAKCLIGFRSRNDGVQSLREESDFARCAHPAAGHGLQKPDQAAQVLLWMFAVPAH